MDSLSVVQKLAVWALPVLFAVTLHEVAHGWVARSLGDPTAARLGRLSLNPLNHVDPLGTLLIPGLLLAFGGFIFGWAKPVPVDWRNFKHPRRDMAVVAVAGPLSNLAMALGWGLVYKYATASGATAGLWYGLALMGKAGMVINVSLMVLNLLPLPPLDGGRVAVGLLPARAAYRYARIEPYGFLILLLLVATGALSAMLYWPYVLSFLGLARVLGLPLT
ncbi:MAG: site-2 protease family protein [Sinobacteraceae bacterium]|nr:site-2 protease family protein [Nevskiaceae bacterium]